LIGLARLCFEKHQKKTAGSGKLIGTYSKIQNGNLNYTKYEYTTNNSPMAINSVVFRTDFDQYYEFSLIPMNISGKPIPDKVEREKVFRSIVSMIQY
jgi:hypothetical protein